MADTGTGGSACGDPVIGSRLGGYVIEAVLGRGAMGKVYRARQVSLDRPVALKVMISYLSQREDLVARFRREAMAAARLNHPNVVQVYDFVEAEGACFYVMELVDGLSLGDYLNRGERFSEREVIEVGREVTMALEAVHEAGIIHRDIKPGNLMLTSRGLIKLSDLGLARVHDLGTDVSLTLTGMNVGTPLYMAPEQAQGAKTVDGRADFYALGATLYHLAVGRPPFVGETPGAILMRQVHESPPDACALNPSLGRAFADLLRWMMAARQEDRPGSHGAILAVLDRCQDDVRRRKAAGPSRIVSSTLSPSPEEKGLPRGAKRWPVWGVFAGALAATAVAGWLATRPEQEPKPSDVATAEHAENAEGTVSTTKGTGGTKDAQGVPVPAAPPPTSPAAASPAPIPERMVEAPCAPETSNAKTETSPQGQTLTGSAAETPAARAKPLATQEELMVATKEKPFVNFLEMKFVPIPSTRVLFSIWETRVKDFEAFVKDSGYDWHEKPSFEQTPEDPVVSVSWNDAKAFCDWLSKKEGKQYRLPTDEEWDAAVGKDKYPWGNDWPPPKDAENFAGEESKSGRKGDPRSVITGYRDGHSRTSPAGTYKATETGLYDISGNITEWIEDWFTEALYRKHREKGGYEMWSDELAGVKKGNVFRVKRGGNWYFGTASSLVLSVRAPGRPIDRFNNIGFRCVVAGSSPFPAVAEGTLVRTPAAVAATPAPAEKAAAEPSSATKEKPFVNSLGMRFVSIPGTKVLFSIWETRVKDFEAFVKESGYSWNQNPGFEQTPDHPVVRVSWNDAMAFCEWLSKKEGGQYRLPRDEEWDAAVGKEKYPWGGEWPPPNGAENNRGEELRDGGLRESRTVQFGYQDEHPNTAPVGCYRPTGLGLFDIGGNVREWVEDWYTSDLYTKHLKGGGLPLGTEVISAIGRGSVYHVVRGGNWRDYSAVFCVSSYRYSFISDQREDYIGFRCALVASSRFPALVVPALAAGGTGHTMTGSASIPGQLPGSRSLGPFTPDEAKELDTILAQLREAAASAKQAASDRIAKYMKDLEELEGKAAARSDLDAVVKLRKEREVWDAGQRVPKADASARMPSEYSNLRYFLDRDLGLADGRAESAIKRETAKAVSGLQALEARLTRAKRIEAALAVREFVDKMEKGEVPWAAAAPAAPAPGAGMSNPKEATKNSPFVNSLGMRFVPVKGTGVLFSVWETRVKDFAAFVKENGYDWHEKSSIEQGPDFPVVRVSWNDAKAFCAWLSKKEGKQYRLPTDEEWDTLVSKGSYPWGDEWPPPDGAGNFAGEEAMLGKPDDPKERCVIQGYRDRHPRIAPVGAYRPHRSGLYDLSGNVWECCEDWYTERIVKKSQAGGGGKPAPEQMADILKGDARKVVRGGSWRDWLNFVLRSSNRLDQAPDSRSDIRGFRCVLVLP